jgi:hypothetical protein
MARYVKAKLGMLCLLAAGQAMAHTPVWLANKQKVDSEIAAQRAKLRVLAQQAEEVERTNQEIGARLQRCTSASSAATRTTASAWPAPRSWTRSRPSSPRPANTRW